MVTPGPAVQFWNISLRNNTSVFRLMNSTSNDSIPPCSLQDRVYTPGYLLFKLLNATYLRLLIGPGILLNILCLIVLSRPRLSNKSTTIVFLRFLAVFDIFAITLKYIRAEINYQSIEKGHQISLLIPSVCKALYVLMNSSISISMWTIVLMSFDKAVAVSYPLKSSIWVTHRRAFYICCVTIVTLSLANLSFIQLSGIRTARNRYKYCGLKEGSFIVDLLTASILPMGLITIANIVIAVVLHRVSRVALDGRTSDDNIKRPSEPQFQTLRLLTPAFNYRASAEATSDIVLAAKRRTSTQVTRMLLAVTLSLIICNIPNTIFFVFVNIYDTRQLLVGRLCVDVTDKDIKLYKFGFYSSVIQDILSDLPHIFNFFLYCFAGKKFRSIFINKVHHFLRDIHLTKRKERRFTQSTCPSNGELLPQRKSLNLHQGLLTVNIPLSKTRKSVDVLYNGKITQTILNDQNKNVSRQHNQSYKKDERRPRSHTTIQ